MFKRDFQKKTHGIRKYKRTYINFLKKNHVKFLEENPKPTNLNDYGDFILKNFSFLLRLNLTSLNESNFINEINLIKLIAREISSLAINKAPVKAKLLDQLLATVDKSLLVYDFAEFDKNLETEIIQEFRLPDIVVRALFTFHHFYSALAVVFASPFKSKKDRQVYYEYGYYLAMYLNLWNFINPQSDPPDYLLFSVKLRTQEKLITALETLSPKYFNIFFTKINRWVDQINFAKLKK